MKIRFQADADFNQNILRAVRRRNPAIDFQTAGDAELSGVEDEEVLRKAARENRLLVSHDRRTMPFHFARFIATQTSTGLIIVSQDLPIRQAAEELALIWEASEAEEWINRIASLPV